MAEQLVVESRLPRAGADQSPQSVHANLTGRLLIHHELFQLRPRGCLVSFAKQALGDVAEVDIWTVQPLNQLVVALLGEVEATRARRALVANPVQPAALPVDAVGVAAGVLVTVIAIVPVEDVKATVRTRLLRHRHEP